MSKVIMNLEALRDNMQVVDKWLTDAGATWTLVTKVFCGHQEYLKALASLGVRSMADSRLTNLQEIHEEVPDVEQWYLRIPSLSSIGHVVRIADVSLNSEIAVITKLSEEAQAQGRHHKIIIMIELGDLREGILPGSLVHFYRKVFELPNIEVLGIGSNMGCISGAIPTIDQFMQLALYKELLELKFERPLPIISAGSSSSLSMLREGLLPKSINHFRIGESIYFGNNLLTGEIFPELRNDVFTIEAEIIEIKMKGLVPYGETSSDASPFIPVNVENFSPGQRGNRAVVNLGQLDTEISGLVPIDSDHVIAGASSDVMVVNVGNESSDLQIGDNIRFRPDYAALARAMNSRYVDKIIDPSVAEVEDLQIERNSLSANFSF